MGRLTFLDICSGWGLNGPGISVLGIVSMISLRGLLMRPCMIRRGSGRRMTLQSLDRGMSHMQTSGVLDSHARISPLRESRGGLEESKWGLLQHY